MEKFMKSVSTTMIDTVKFKEMMSSKESSNEITTGAKSIPPSSSEKTKKRTKRKTLTRFEKQTVDTTKSKQKTDEKKSDQKMTDEKNSLSSVKQESKESHESKISSISAASESQTSEEQQLQENSTMDSSLVNLEIEKKKGIANLLLPITTSLDDPHMSKMVGESLNQYLISESEDIGTYSCYIEMGKRNKVLQTEIKRNRCRATHT